ncbi:WD40 repeat-like protein [Calocera cornea HHB12733]|uniref:WD40 repeat-like protein n=1 Tax=Calocera cornea HHB12733 TaxID=1353952 RepID=A0A165DUG1_9BASI|nr:WD40 repeat-like protein [Calocera cornea HHB12733]
MSRPPHPLPLPQITVQPTLPAVLADVASSLVPAEDVWISCYLHGARSVHGKARVERDRDAPGGVRLSGRDGVEVEWANSATLLVACPVLHIPPTPVRFPRQSLPLTPGRQITSLAPSPDLARLATANADGEITLTPLPAPGAAQPPSQTFRPHLSTVLSVRFFPSSAVLLSAGSDTQLQISPVAPPLLPARTLRGHKRGVTDTHIIGRGRQVVSCAKDGTVRLWDVGAGTCASTLGTHGWSAALAMAGMQPPRELDLSYLREDPPAPVPDPDPTDGPAPGPGPGPTNGTNGAPPEATSEELPLLAVALSSGSFTLLDLRAPSQRTLYTSPRPSSSPSLSSPSPTSPGALQSLALSPLALYTGSTNGVIAAYDLRMLTRAVWEVRRNGSSVEGLVLTERGLAVGTEDGLPWLLSTSSTSGSGTAALAPALEGPGPAVREEWAGWECDAVRCVRAEGGSVWMAGDDGVVRRY